MGSTNIATLLRAGRAIHSNASETATVLWNGQMISCGCNSAVEQPISEISIWCSERSGDLRNARGTSFKTDTRKLHPLRRPRLASKPSTNVTAYLLLNLSQDRHWLGELERRIAMLVGGDLVSGMPVIFMGSEDPVAMMLQAVSNS